MLCSKLSWLFAHSLLLSHLPCCAFIALFWVQFFYRLPILCCQVCFLRVSICKFTLKIIPLAILYFPPLCLLRASAMFLVSFLHHSFLSAFSQLLSCFLPHRCFHMAVVPEVAYSVGECLCTDLSIRFCLNEFQLLFLLVLSPFHCHHFLCELQWRSVSKSKLLEVMECKVFDSDSWFFLC